VTLELENFKSYAGHHVIGPFYPFTCVIGPNGSGKSNLVDALLFVMGASAKEMRCSVMSELIHSSDRHDHQEHQQERDVGPANKASVSMLYEVDGGDQRFRFTRTVMHNSASVYSINGKDVSWKEYNTRLESLSILTHSKNYLVQQHEVRKLSLKKPRELTELFERVSGSGMLKKDYEDAKLAEDVAQAEFVVAMKRRKDGESEKDKIAVLKRQAAEYQSLTKEMDKVKVQEVLAKLWIIECDVRREKQELEQASAELQSLEQEEGTSKERRLELKKQRAKLQKEISKLEKELAQIVSQLVDKDPESVGIRESLVEHERSLKVYERNLQKYTDELRLQHQELQQLHEDLKNAQKDREAYLRSEVGASSSSGVDLENDMSPEIKARYEALKSEAYTKTLTMRQEQTTELRLVEKDEAALAFVKAKMTRFDNDIAGAEEVRAAAADQLREVEEKIANNAADLRRLDDAIRTSQLRRQQLTETVAAQKDELKILDEKINECRSAVRETQHAKQMREAMQYMQSAFRGVKGRLVDLLTVSISQYRPAIAALLGPNIDAIVVEDTKTARDCISYLREQRIGSSTFLPLESLRVKSTAERLRSLGGSSKLALDLVEYDPSVEKAVLFSLGSAVVCDTLEEARSIAFGPEGLGQSEGVKIATLDGSLIHKNGNISGGLAHVLDKSRKWDQAELGRLKNQKVELRRNLDDAERELRTVESATKASEDRYALDSVQKALLKEQTLIRKKLGDAIREIAAITSKKNEVGPEHDNLKSLVEQRHAAIAEKRTQIASVEDKLFKDISAAIGVRNIREYEASLLAKRVEREKRLHEFDNLIAKIENSIEFLNRHDHAKQAEKWKSLCEDCKKSIDDLQQRREELRATVNQLSEKKRITDEELEKLKARILEYDAQLRDTSSNDRMQQKEIGNLKKKCTAIEDRLALLRRERLGLVDKCRVEGVVIPKDSADEAVQRPMSDEDDDGSRRRRGGRQNANVRVAFQYSEPIESADGSSSCIVFSGLSSEFLAFENPRDRELHLTDLEKQLRVLVAKREELNPNSRAGEQLKVAETKLRQALREADEARDARHEAEQKFREIKKKRYTLFMSAYTPVQANIAEVYSLLTADDQFPTGGHALLSLENPEEPYLAGIKFTCTPPGKRNADDLSARSGGEQTVSALALLLAFHSFQPSPFFVFDEIDAALDSVNVSKVVSFMRRFTRHLSAAAASPSQLFAGTQCIVISHKEAFFHKADALVGVCRDESMDGSKVLTLDLTQLDA
jgi:structural maintenance of chromosome 1